MTYIKNVTLENQSTVSTNNSTTIPLAASGSFTGIADDVQEYGSISVCATVAPSNASGTLFMEFSPDNVIWTLGSGLRQIAIPITAANAVNTIHDLIPISQYFRVRYDNNDTSQDVLNIQTIYCKSARIAIPTSRLSQTLTSYTDVLNTRSAIFGQTDGGYWNNVSVDPSEGGMMRIGISQPLAAFGEVLVAEPTPVAQVDFVYGINRDIHTSGIIGSGTVLSQSGLCIVDTTANTNSTATLASRKYLKYRPGQGGLGKFTALFTTGVSGSKQYAGIGSSDLNNGFFFGYDGATFGIFHINNGSTEFVPQTSWNLDVCDGTRSSSNKSGFNLQHTNGNIYQIKYQYLGFGVIKFYIANSLNGLPIQVHIIKFPNTSLVPSVSNPSMRMVWSAVNTSNSSSVKVKGASGSLFNEGKIVHLGPKRGLDNNKTSITTETNIFTIKNCSNFNNIPNQAQLRVRSISFGSNTGGVTSGLATCKITRNAVLGGSPSWTPIDGTTGDSGISITGESIASYDFAGTTVSGLVVYNNIAAVGNSANQDLTDFDIFISPGETLTFSITSSQSVAAGVGVTWNEDL